MIRGRRFTGILLLVGAVGLVGIGPGGAAPTLTGITIDGNMADWAGVLANPENVILDGPGGGLMDADAVAQANLNVDTVAFTWDATYLYFYVHRTGSSGEFNYLFFHFDLDNDGRVANNSPILRVGWWGTNQRTETSLDTYRAAGGAAGDPITNGLGRHDGYKLPGTRVAGAGLESLIGGAAGGLAMETRVSWASLGLAPGAPLQFHLSTARKLIDYPAQIRDNAGGGTAFQGVDLSPDHAVGYPPGGLVALAHTVTNLGNAADTFDLTWSSTGDFAPAAVAFWLDADGSGTLTAADNVLTDTDGDGTIDTGLMTRFTTLSILVAATLPSTPTLGQVCTLTLRARSSVKPAITDTAVDTITIAQPSLTLVKAVDLATAPPGGVLTYTVTYANAGGSDAIQVVVVDPVPAGSTYVAGSASGAGMAITWSHDGALTWDSSDAAPVTHVRWQLGAPLAPGGTGSVSFQVTVN